MTDIFVVSSESEMRKASSLANRASKAYYMLKDRNTPYAKSLFACYILMARIRSVIIDTQEDYRRGRIIDEDTETIMEERKDL